MTKSSVISSVFLVVMLAASTLFVPNAAIESSPQTKNKIEHICRAMEEFQFCYNTFYNNLQQPDADNITLTRITIVEAENNATNTLLFIEEQLPMIDPNQRMHYLVCAYAYQVVQQSFKQAFQAFNKGDYTGMANYERDTPRAQASCTTIFQASPLTENPLNERNRVMRILIAMAVVTGTLIVT